MNKLNRREVITGMLLALGSYAVGRKLMINDDKEVTTMPVLFLGHGSPMNALANNSFTQSLNSLGKRLPKPKAILVISAHWETNGTWVTGMEKPKTIHDFYGFPNSLFEVQYPAPGSPEFANEVAKQIVEPKVGIDQNSWGLDHGTWSVLKHVYPDADIPVFQLSLDKSKPIEFHYELGKQLQFLREQGVLIVGSGNIVHNLRETNWKEKDKAHEWALEFDEWTKNMLIDGNHNALVKEPLSTQAGKLSIPTLEHYLPMLYILGASNAKDTLQFEYEGIELSSLSMRCFSLG